MKNSSAATQPSINPKETGGLSAIHKFRTIEEWRAALMALPDQNFFELLRSVFGNIKTPFNKQRLMDDLYALLLRDDIRQAISAYIDEKDHLLIAAIALLNSPGLVEFENFFSVDLPYGELHALIRNMEERLIIFRFDAGEERRIALNPALQSVLAPFIADIGQVFPSFPKAGSPVKGEDKNDEVKSNVYTSDDRTMAAVFAYIESEKNVFKQDGIRKKIYDDAKHLFPNLEIELIISVLERLGLFFRQEELFVPDKRRVNDFSLLGKRERQEYWTAALYLHLNESFNSVKSISAWETYSNSRLKEMFIFIHGLLNLLDPQKRYPKVTLRRYACLLAREYSNKDPWGRNLFGNSPEFRLEPFLDTLEKCCLITIEDGCIASADVPAHSKKAKENAVIAMDSPVSFVLYPDISLSEAVVMASFCELGEDGRYMLTRSSAIRYFDSGSSSADLIELLKELSENRIDDSLEFMLKDWEARYLSVSLYNGEVMVLAEDQRYLSEVKPLSTMIKKMLAPGVYLLRTKERHEITKALLKAGVDIFSQSDAKDGDNKSYKYQFNSFPAPSKNAVLPPVFTAISGAASTSISSAAAKTHKAKESESPQAAMKKRFSEHLKEMKLTDMEREELSARIERKLVLTETQLETSSLKYEKLEAKGLDYNGKTLLARQAITTGSLVEVSWTDSEGEPRTIAGVPSALEKRGAEIVLIIPSQDQDAGEMHIPLRKIGRLRRIKQSIFEK